MRFSPGFFGSLLTGSGDWEINLDNQDIRIRAGGTPATKIDYPSVNAVSVTPGVVWSKIHIQSGAYSFNLDGIANEDARLLKNHLEKRVAERLSQILNKNHSAVRTLVSAIEEFLKLPQYLAHRDITQWINRQESKHSNSVKETLSTLRHPYALKDAISSELLDGATKLLSVLSGNSDVLKQRNDDFVESEMLAHKAFLDSVEKTPLTREQRVASIVMEDRNLLVAAAGSGKTSTVVGKIGYALLKGIVAPDEILVLAFNNHAALELEERIQERLGPLLGERMIKVKTFHALGMEVIAETTGKKPSIANFAGGGEAADGQLMSELVESLLATDPAFAVKWLLFLALCRRPAKNPAEFKSVQDWQSYVKETGDYQKGESGYLTLNGELVKSQGELAIANWLFMNGVEYQYERPYQYETADKKYRQYKPDFYFPAINCYLEHYALDAKGNPPKAFGEKYRASMLWKRHLHAEKGTDVFETTFTEFVSGELFDKLEMELTNRGIKLKPRSREEVLERLNQPKLSAELSSLLRTFIKHAKSNELAESTLVSRASIMPQPYRARLFAAIASKVMTAYEKKIQSQGEVDFEDLIVNAAHHAAGEQFTHPYKLILVDEFQDISRARAKLLLSFLDKAPDCKLFAVGDDWQSIYRFAGSDIAIFTEFEKIFGYTATNYLTQTFRSNQGIADIAASFVQRNPSQMRKKVVAQDKTTDNVVVIRKYERLQEMEGLVEAALAELDAELKTTKKPAKVFILGRYRHQSSTGLGHWQKQFAATLDIEFRTIHASKGLQADYVILIGLHSRKSAFPSEIADDPLLQMVMPTPETFPHSEERRLFYVALTRARHRVYLLGGKHTPSCFLTELPDGALLKPLVGGTASLEKKDNGAERCPRCEVGHLLKRNGKHGIFLGCTEYPNCNFTRNTIR
jgi:DNA helicase-4